ncbi:DNA repair protein [Pseudolactococcus paracarnosus]|uniref:DNA repair protein n=1 Tax=Pseudolactococcus paracarnosus TaxID=2749962 RepID=A0A7L4WC27_9LACT|nr:DNA repair protein [Lactococcus paracarnosus]SPC35751.1 conserved hypothetical protein [Lactococcus piscium]MCJ1976504.1 DNA repair protein [Lactococcus paracarnosus]MCJ1982707.1 DNA repair protein [Lactococcus paracarnosus]MCJ1994543.1 DNA repair protein [Lactococcus paracarnosus]MCJ1997679.1 DNA repair protein [Lactococcus paracarnosus]
MNQKELKKLRRSDLFKLLVEQANKIEQQQSEIDALEMQLQDRKLTIENAGSIAEASLALNKVFETAQLAADLYIENIKQVAHDVTADEDNASR